MFSASSSIFLLVLSLAPSFLAPQVTALPTTSLQLARGWSDSSRLSSALVSRAIGSELPFTAEQVLTAGCVAECIPLVSLNTTCGTAYYQPDCDMCSTAGLDAYTTCTNCYVSKLTSTTTITQSKAFRHASLVLSKIEKDCTSYTRTALPTVQLALPGGGNATLVAASSTGSGSTSAAARGTVVRLGLALSVCVGAIWVSVV